MTSIYPKGATHHERQAIVGLFFVAVAVLVVDVFFLIFFWNTPPTQNIMWFWTFSIAVLFLSLAAMFFIVYGVLVRNKKRKHL